MTFLNKFYKDVMKYKVLKIIALQKLQMGSSDSAKFMKRNLELGKTNVNYLETE